MATQAFTQAVTYAHRLILGSFQKLPHSGCEDREKTLVVDLLGGLYLGVAMPTQTDIADHLGMSQQAVSKQMEPLGLDWRVVSMDVIRLAYIEHLRAVASGHRSVDGFDLARERAMTEQVDREIKQITLAEKKGQVVNLAQLEPELTRMYVAFRTELLARDDKLKAEIDTLYGIDLDLNYINEHTRNALAQLARYEPSRSDVDHAPGAVSDTARDNGHHTVGKAA